MLLSLVSYYGLQVEILLNFIYDKYNIPKIPKKFDSLIYFKSNYLKFLF